VIRRRVDDDRDQPGAGKRAARAHGEVVGAAAESRRGERQMTSAARVQQHDRVRRSGWLAHEHRDRHAGAGRHAFDALDGRD
jgi:hypothetical protein